MQLMTVATHKTGYRTPAVLALNEDIWALLNQFFRLRKVLLSNQLDLMKDNAAMFLSYAGKEMTSDVNNALQSLWHSACPGAPKVSATKLRKATVTHVRKDHPQMREALVCHMTRMPATADNFYLVHNRLTESAEVTGWLIRALLPINSYWSFTEEKRKERRLRKGETRGGEF